MPRGWIARPADGAGPTADLPGLTTDAVDTATGLSAASHGLRRQVRKLAPQQRPRALESLNLP